MRKIVLGKSRIIGYVERAQDELAAAKAAAEKGDLLKAAKFVAWAQSYAAEANKVIAENFEKEVQ